MKYYNHFFLFMYLRIQIQASLSSPTNVEDYLDEKLTSLSMKQEVQLKQNDSNYVINFLDYHSNVKSWQFAHSFNTFNDSYLMLDRDFYTTFRGKSILPSRIAEIIHDDRRITIARMIEFENLAIMFVVLDSKDMRIIKFENSVLKYQEVQTIQHPLISDAKFIKKQNELYLLVSNYKSSSFKSLSIYKWKDDQFDEQEQFRLSMKGVNQLKTFEYEGNEIILLMQKEKNHTFYCNIYELGNKAFTNKQRLKLEGSRHVLPYKIDNDQYVLFWNIDTSFIYKWNGFELMEWSTLKIESNFEKVLMMYANNTPIIFASHLNKLIAIKPTPEGLEFIKVLEYRDKFTEILDMNYVKKHDNDLLVVIGNIEHSGRIEVFDVRVSHSKNGSLTKTQDPLYICLTKLDEYLQSHGKSGIAKKLLNELEQKAAGKSMASYSMKSRNHEITQIEIEDKFAEIEEKYGTLTPLVNRLEDREGELIINGMVIISGSLNGTNISAENVNLKSINGRKWSPNQWLSYTVNQTISGGVDVENLDVKRLDTSNVQIFNDMLLNGTKNTFRGNVVIQKLITEELEVNRINNIEIKDIFFNERDSIIGGTKTVTQFTAKTIKAENIENTKSQDFLEVLMRDDDEKAINFGEHVTIEDLEVEDIDNVNWNTFRHSVFRYGVTESISGNLRINNFDTKNLNLVSLNGVEIENLMTTNTDQNISASLTFPVIYTTNLTASTFNGIPLTEVAATTNSPVVKGPVSIQDIHVFGNLIINSSVDDFTFQQQNQHIVGTNESDLLQVYTDKIKIIGNLKVKNLKTRQTTRILIGNEKEQFVLNLKKKYWMKNENQVIPVHVVHKKITTSHLRTKLLNENGMLNYLVNDTVKSLPASFLFDNVTFLGSIFLNKQKVHQPNLRKIDNDSVKLNGSFVVKGKKLFNDTLKIRSLITDTLNDIGKEQLVISDGISQFSGVKQFKTLVIDGSFKSEHDCKNSLNDVNLQKLMEETVYINSSQEIRNLNFTNIAAEYLNVDRLNDRPMRDYVSEIEHTIDSGVIDTLIINGKLFIGNLLNLSKINEKEPSSLFTDKLKLNERGEIHGVIRFSDNVTVDNLSVSLVNDIFLPDLTRRLFYKSGNQTISERFTFKNLKTENLVVPQINNISVNTLVDIGSSEPQVLNATNGINFDSTVLTRLFGETISPCNIEVAMDVMQSPPTRSWSRVRVNGNVTILDENSSLFDIFENVVLLNEENTIKAPVHFSNFSASNLKTFEHINAINLADIFSDALMKLTDDHQIVVGRKIFNNITISRAKVLGNSDIAVINGINLAKFSETIMMKDEINHVAIQGRKTFFAGLQTEKINCKTVSNLFPENLVTTNNQRVIPSVTFQNLDVKLDLFTQRLNDQDFDHFLKERLLISGPPHQEVSAIYSFNEVEIDGDVTTPSMNGVSMEDVIYDVDNQEILSRKTFFKSLDINGDVFIEMLNGYKISDIYEMALLKHKECKINGNVKILKPSYVNGSIQTEFVNGHSIKTLMNILSSETQQQQVTEVTALVTGIQDSVMTNYKLIERMPSEIMYIEKSKEFLLPISDTIDSQVLRLKDYVLIHIIGRKEGPACGLPLGCSCPEQYSIEISQMHSINVLPSKSMQRIYSYGDGFMTVHFITNGVSTSEMCRTNTSTEESKLTWSTTTVKSDTIVLNFKGYVSAVEYFSLRNTTYVIAAEYYDSVANSYDLECIVYEFSEDLQYVTEIQRIKTMGAWNLKVFYTAQGVNLIIGMLGDGQPDHNFEKTLFMRFDRNTKKFDLLREVQAYGCSSSLGVTLDRESFIVLAHRKYPVLIFKYDAHQDNYIYYQNLWDPLPIRAISLFYVGGVGISDPYLCVVSERGVYSIYTYEYVESWQRKFYSEIKGLRSLIPYEINDELYLFAPSTNMSAVLTVVKYGSL